MTRPSHLAIAKVIIEGAIIVFLFRFLGVVCFFSADVALMIFEMVMCVTGMGTPYPQLKEMYPSCVDRVIEIHAITASRVDIGAFLLYTFALVALWCARGVVCHRKYKHHRTETVTPVEEDEKKRADKLSTSSFVCPKCRRCFDVCVQAAEDSTKKE